MSDAKLELEATKAYVIKHVYCQAHMGCFGKIPESGVTGYCTLKEYLEQK
jgi:hypothetical protein